MRYLKGKFLMMITYLKKSDNEKLIVDKEIVQKCNAKDFEEALMVAESEKRKMTIEFVNQKPEKFQIGTLYVLKDGKRVWTWQIRD